MSDIINSPKHSELTNAVQIIKDAILQSQQRALSAINQEQLALYYAIGNMYQEILEIKIGVKDSSKL